MTDQRPMFACEFCTAEYVTPLAASLCCDKEYDKDDDQH